MKLQNCLPFLKVQGDARRSRKGTEEVCLRQKSPYGAHLPGSPSLPCLRPCPYRKAESGQRQLLFRPCCSPRGGKGVPAWAKRAPLLSRARARLSRRRGRLLPRPRAQAKGSGHGPERGMKKRRGISSTAFFFSQSRRPGRGGPLPPSALPGTGAGFPPAKRPFFMRKAPILPRRAPLFRKA